MIAVPSIRSIFPVAVVCPVCNGPLQSRDGYLECSACHGHYSFEEGFPNLIVGDRFEDDLPDSDLAFEETSCIETTRAFWVPLFRRTWPNPERPPVILSVGCGVATEIDELSISGFNPVGIDCGNRSRVWARRVCQDRLLLANGLKLPFESRAFDGVFCGCVFPHVGVQGDSFRVATDFHQKRVGLAREIARVLKPGGQLFAANPNRLFPFDMFHRRKGGSLRPRWNSPYDPFLLSLSDFRCICAEAGYRSVAPLPPQGYWHFNRSRRTWIGRALGFPVRALFLLNSQSAHPAVRASIVAPWLVMQATKNESA